MPIYIYSAKSLNGELKTGSQEAASESELAHALREQGFILTSARLTDSRVKKRNQLMTLLPSFGRVSLAEKMLFARHLGVMIGAGLPLTRALEILNQQTENKAFSKIIQKLNDDIKKGQSLAEALNKHPKVFSELFVNMVKIGEASGNLEGVLKILMTQMEKEHELISKVRGAMIYPAVVLSTMFGVGILLMILVVPKLVQIFEEAKAELPLSTRAIIVISSFLEHQWLIALIGLIVLIIILRFLWKIRKIRSYIDWVVLQLPVFGEITKKINSARLSRTLGSLIESGVPIIQGLQIVSGTLDNYFFRQSIIESASLVQKGEPLSRAIKGYPHLYPVMVEQMMAVGEETGTLGEILGKLAEFYEAEVVDITKGLSSIIEPVLMIVIGIAVGFFAISIIQPMYSIMQSI